MLRPALAVTAALLIGASVLFVLPLANAQQPIRVSVNEVIVPVTVTDDKGRFVSDLQKKDFHIFDEGKRADRRFSSVTSSRSPL